MGIDIAEYAAKKLPVAQFPIVLRPEWRNPVSEGGRGALLKLVLHCSVNELIRKYRREFIQTMHIAQGAKLYVKKSPIDQHLPDHISSLLKRTETDMVPHNDATHCSDFGVTMISGSHSIGSACLDKKSVARFCLDEPSLAPMSADEMDVSQVELVKEYAGNVSLQCIASSIRLMDILASINQGSSDTIETEPNRLFNFWECIKRINHHSEVISCTTTPHDLREMDQFFCLTASVYHFKQFDSTHNNSTTIRDKQRLELVPKGNLFFQVRKLHNTLYTESVEDPFET